jgi:hypothetical protein
LFESFHSDLLHKWADLFFATDHWNRGVLFVAKADEKKKELAVA